MINTLNVATSGYFKRGAKFALSVAVSGYLAFTPTNVDVHVPVLSNTGGGGGIALHQKTVNKKFEKKQQTITITVNDNRQSKTKKTGIKVKITDVDIIENDDNPTISISLT